MKPKKCIIKSLQQKTAAIATDEDLAAINALALAEMTADDVYVRTAYLAHNGIDRDKEVFDDSLLEAFANSLPGKGLFIKHPMGYDGDSGPGIGRWFRAQVVDMSLDESRAVLKEPKLQFPPSTETAKLLEASFYIPRTEKNAGLLADIDAGIAGDLSIGFRTSDRAPITDGVSDDVIAYRLMAPGEAYEGSLVWLGAQPGARVHKAASLSNPDIPTSVDALQEENARLKKTIAHLIEKQFKLLNMVNRGKTMPVQTADGNIESGKLTPLNNPLNQHSGPDLAAQKRAAHNHKDHGIPFITENPAISGEVTTRPETNSKIETPDLLKNPAIVSVRSENKSLLDNPAINSGAAQAAA